MEEDELFEEYVPHGEPGIRPAPPEEGGLPGREIIVRVGADIRLDLEGLPDRVVGEVMRQLTFHNPLHRRMIKTGRNDPRITESLQAWWKEDNELVVARGFARRLMRILQANRFKPRYQDNTNHVASVGIAFRGELYGYQLDIVSSVASRRFGIITGSIGYGKKVVALYLISRSRLPALIIVNNRWQLYQWKELMEQFLVLEQDQIGLIGDGRKERGRSITIAVEKGLYGYIDEIKDDVGFLVVDRCDQVHLNIFWKLARKIASPYMLGLAIERKRKDRLTNLMCAYLGPVLHEIPAEKVYTEFSALRPELVKRNTGFDFDFKDNYGDMIQALSQDQERNSMIVSDILAETAEPTARAIVICERRKYMEELRERLEGNYRNVEMVSGLTKEDDLERILRSFKKRLQVICVTVKSLHLLKVRPVTHLFIVSPIKHGEYVSQALSKVLWLKGETAPKVFDYVDKPLVLQGGFKKRLKIYTGMGVRVGD